VAAHGVDEEGAEPVAPGGPVEAGRVGGAAVGTGGPGTVVRAVPAARRAVVVVVVARPPARAVVLALIRERRRGHSLGTGRIGGDDHRRLGVRGRRDAQGRLAARAFHLSAGVLVGHVGALAARRTADL